MSEKVYVLADPTDLGHPPAKKVKPGAHPKPLPKAAPPAPPEAAPGVHPSWMQADDEETPEPSVERAPRQRRRVAPTQALGLVLSLYALGGLAPLALQIGRRRGFWAALGIVSLGAWVNGIWFWPALRDLLSSGRVPLGPVAIGLAVVTALGTAAWSRAVLLAGGDPRFDPSQLPAWIRSPGFVALLGWPLPGLGLLLSGRPVRAALS